MNDKRYGHFDDQHREYVITDPKTPWPWINYLGNEDFFSLISNTAGGYSFYKDAKFRRITRYRYNNVPMDNGGRYFYINDNGNIWNPGWKPCKTPLDFYECRHGMSYTRITGRKNGIEASVLFFVPLNTFAEVQKLTAQDLISLGIIDAIIPEPIGAAHRNKSQAVDTLKKELLKYLNKSIALAPEDRKQESGIFTRCDVAPICCHFLRRFLGLALRREYCARRLASSA